MRLADHFTTLGALCTTLGVQFRKPGSLYTKRILAGTLAGFT
jgi:hypothetical protein